MRSCMWITSAVGSSDSAASRATGVAAAALSLSSAPTTAYPVIFFSILTAMTRFLVFVFVGLGAGGHVAGGAGEERDPHPNPSPALRSEEHTSELQSLMRTSYDAFCLKKKHTEHT